VTRQAPTETPFAWPVRVYWEDTDAGGIVFYANYLKFFERARTEWLRSRGLEQRALIETTGGMFVVSDTTLRYHRPARLDDELVVTAWPLETGRASMTMQQQAFLKSPEGNILLCEGTIRAGWVDASTYKPARIPPNLLEILK
jgi:acyl-CoA thioester hydrolase